MFVVFLLSFSKGALVSIAHDGMHFRVEDGRSLQADVTLLPDLFIRFELQEGDSPLTPFKINLSILMDCLGVFGFHAGGIALSMFWQGEGHDLQLM